MYIFEYSAINPNKSNNIIIGTVKAPTIEMAILIVMQQGFKPFNVYRLNEAQELAHLQIENLRRKRASLSSSVYQESKASMTSSLNDTPPENYRTSPLRALSLVLVGVLLLATAAMILF